METVVRDGVELGKLTLMPYFEIFSRFDEGGKIRFLSDAFSRYHNKEDWSNRTKEENEFCETLKKAIEQSGIWALLTTVEGNRTYSWRRGFNIIDVTRETDRILNDEEYRNHVDTELVRHPGLYEIIKQQEND